MKEYFVSYDIAVKLKEKGFNGKCFAYYMPKGSNLIFNHNPYRGRIVEDCLYSNNSLPNECIGSDFVDAPTINQILRWLREEKKLFVDITLCAAGYYGYVYSTVFPKDKDFSDGWIFEGKYDTYELAALAGIEYVLDNLI